ncbi:neural cell adhesion molecule L1-like protein [Bufo bufo]|uniref:neural cell adhesion molecule L1-like protein n=1 Tax=Bufo bufo TaxID=8384 RepID=UPI001ABED63A|nr:neural cell adhesion molecule L1-like protein [Bufo bufo]XP_040262583.1 neural cell adhesion molecule L1-like protein [Bufo bufo]XP_040262584.1 neural cell adhesion molecule L1-like protein [Bufo bufo]
MLCLWGKVVFCLLSFIKGFKAVEIPLEVEQLPTVIEVTKGIQVAFPVGEDFTIKCKAKGNPTPEYHWTKNGHPYNPFTDQNVKTVKDSGSFIIHNDGNILAYNGTYRCYATNTLGTAVSEETTFLIPGDPRFPKEVIPPIELEEGNPLVLICDPPPGIPPVNVVWMTQDLRQIPLSKRVSVGLDGKLYFAHVVHTDSTFDYFCVAVYSRIRHMSQRTPVKLSIQHSNVIKNRAPNILTTQGGMDKSIVVLKGEVLQLECIAEGLPTPINDWRKEGEESIKYRAIVEGHGTLLKIKDITKDDQGVYICEAKNEMGSDQQRFHVLVEEPPRWIKKLKNSIQAVGSEVILNCSATGTPEPEIHWQRNGIPLRRDTLPHNHKMTGGIIFIHSLQPSDSAVYQCEASNKHGTILTSANIDVVDIVPLIFTDENTTYTAVWGQNVSLLCNNFAFPVADIVWYHGRRTVQPKSGRYIIDNNDTLHIWELEAKDAGSYTCEVSNTKGSASVKANLILREPTKVYVSPENPGVRRWHSITLTCHVQCDPHLCSSVRITWMKDGQELREDNRRIQVNLNRLSINDVNWEDGGTYNCIASTWLDSMSAESHLTVRDVPMPPENVQLLEKQNRSVVLSWTPGDSHNSPISEFIIQSIKSIDKPGEWEDVTRAPGNVTSVHVQLIPHYNYQFRVFAMNGIGNSPASLVSENYATPPAAPENNPYLIFVEANRSDEMTVRWEPLSLDEQNGPGLEYRVSWRLHGVETQWHHKKVKRPQFSIKNTPAFVPYDIRVQAVNDIGAGPDPEIHTGYSGEDTPDAAPSNVVVSLVNHMIANVTWTEVSQDRIRGHLSGYKIIYWKIKSLHDVKMHHGERHTLSFSGQRNSGIIPIVHPFCEYQVSVAAYNTRGDGPESIPVSFQTPEGVPEQPQVLRIVSSDLESFTLSWAPPKRKNGILTSYILQHQIINESDVIGGLYNITITNPEAVSQRIPRLEHGMRYKFYLRACTRIGCSKPVSEEGLAQTQATYANVPQSLSTQGWFIGLMCAVALLTLLMLVGCFVQINRGGKYAVKEKEDLHPEPEVQSMKDQFFDDCSSSDKKATNGSMDSLSLDIKTYDSVDSLVQYSDGEHSHFNEDGSFIGAYTESKEKHLGDGNTHIQAVRS